MSLQPKATPRLPQAAVSRAPALPPLEPPEKRVRYGRILSRLLLWEGLISWIWLLSFLTFPVVLLVWTWLPSNPKEDYAYTLAKDTAFPALAGVCSGVGAIVAVFLPLTLQQFTSLPVAKTPEEQFRRQWLVGLQEVTKWNVFTSIFVLMSNTVLVLIGLGDLERLSPDLKEYDRYLVYVSLMALVFGLACFFLQLFALGVREPGSLERVGEGKRHPLLAKIPWYHYIRVILIILLVQILISAILGVVILLGGNRLVEQGREIIFDLCLIVWVPLLAATFITLMTSRSYRDLWRDRFMKKWGAHAALGLLCNTALDSTKQAGLDKSSVKILLNRQDQEPFRGMWLIPGGYRRWGWRSKDPDLPSTVKRRMEKLGVKIPVNVGREELASPTKVLVKEGRMERARKWAARSSLKRLRPKPEGKIPDRWKGRRRDRVRSWIRSRLETIVQRNDYDFSLEYSEAALKYSHAPTDTRLFLVTKEDGKPFSETDIPVDSNASLRWWTLAEIERTREIPAHLKALLCAVFEEQKGSSSLWKLPGKT